MSESGSVLGVENKPEPITFQEIFYRLQIYVEKEKPGLKRFYDPDEFDQNFRDSVTRGLDMTRKLMKIECPREVAAGLSLLALWDLVVLVGMHSLHMFCLCRVLKSFIIHSLTPVLALKW